MLPFLPRRTFAAALLGIALMPSTTVAEPVATRHTEGLVRGFVVLRTLQGETLAGGDISQSSRAGRVTNRLVFHFKDGSIHDETTVFTQQRSFRLIGYHLVQKGPAFPTQLDVTINGPASQVTVRYKDGDGKEKVEASQEKLPPDVANGMVPTLAKNILPASKETIVSMVGATPKPRLVKLKITPFGQEPFTAGGVRHEATHYVVKVEIGGITGVLAGLLGKNPPDTHLWVIGGDVPGFVKSEGPLYLGGPSWRIELTNPVWPQPATSPR